MKDSIHPLLGKNYTTAFFESGKEHAQLLEEKGILVFPHFINTEGLQQIQEEAG